VKKQVCKKSFGTLAALRATNVSPSSKTLTSMEVFPSQCVTIAMNSQLTQLRNSGMQVRSGFSLMSEAMYFSKQTKRNRHLATSGCQMRLLFSRVHVSFFCIVSGF